MQRHGFFPYGPSKAALEAATYVWSQDLEGTGVTANVLVPGGATNTNMVNIANESDRANLIQPQVMGGPVVWLASDASDGTNGILTAGATGAPTRTLVQLAIDLAAANS